MKEYDIKITETVERTVTVKAESVDDAKAQVEEEWGKIDVLLVEPGQFPKRVQIGNELEDLQVAVGGYIEATYPFEDKVAIILNEEGKLNGMPLNRAIFTDEGTVSDIYAGPFLVVGLTEDNFGSLTPKQMEKYEKMFHSPEAFVRMGGGYMVLLVPDDMVKTKAIAKGADTKVKQSPELGDSIF